MGEWINAREQLPELGQVVALKDENTFMNAPNAQGGGDDEEGVNWHGAGYLSEFGHQYWTVFGERRGMTLDSVTHWLPLPR